MRHFNNKPPIVMMSAEERLRTIWRLVNDLDDPDATADAIRALEQYRVAHKEAFLRLAYRPDPVLEQLIRELKARYVEG